MNVTRAPMNNPNLITAMQHAIVNALSSVHTAFPAQIEKYDFSTAKADVKPLLIANYPDGSTMELPVIPNVPVVWPRTSLGSISFPLQRGDGCLVICSERSIDDWLLLGGKGAPADPRMFDLNDAIAIPGLYSFASQTKITNNEDFQITFNTDSGVKNILIKKNGDVEIGGTGLKKLITEEVISKLNSHTHAAGSLIAGPYTVTGTSGATTPNLLPPGDYFTVADDATKKVKAE